MTNQEAIQAIEESGLFRVRGADMTHDCGECYDLVPAAFRIEYGVGKAAFKCPLHLRVSAARLSGILIRKE